MDSKSLQTSKKGVKELVFSAVLYEVIGTICESFLMVKITHKSMTDSLELGIILSFIALLWNTIFNHFFDVYLMKKQGNIVKSKFDRVIHGFGFEGGFSIISLISIMFYFGVGLEKALSLEVSILIFFLIYTVVYTYIYDTIRGKVLSLKKL